MEIKTKSSSSNNLITINNTHTYNILTDQNSIGFAACTTRLVWTWQLYQKIWKACRVGGAKLESPPPMMAGRPTAPSDWPPTNAEGWEATRDGEGGRAATEFN